MDSGLALFPSTQDTQTTGEVRGACLGSLSGPHHIFSFLNSGTLGFERGTLLAGPVLANGV